MRFRGLFFEISVKKSRILGFFALARAGTAPRVRLKGRIAKKGATVNKNDLIQKLADHTGLPKNDAAKAVDGVST